MILVSHRPYQKFLTQGQMLQLTKTLSTHHFSDPSHFESININFSSITESAKELTESWQLVTGENKQAWALKALTLTDLTTLAGDDTASNVQRLCYRAANPFPDSVIASLNLPDEFRDQIHTAAVCVYPSRVQDAYEYLKLLKMETKINVASVATGFPTGSYPLSSRLTEIQYAIANGAREIDIVIDRSLVLTAQWKKLYDEIVEMRKVCGEKAHMKTILGIGECSTFRNVYIASMIAMMAGSDFIKTSTGKEAVNATLPVGLVMIRAIQDFYRITGRRIGLKPAGGVRKVDDAVQWIIMIKKTLGMEWLQPELFRFGASGLLDDIEKQFSK